MNEKKLDLGKLNEVNGGLRAPRSDKNVISRQAVCSQCRHDLVYQPPRSIMGSVQQHDVPICTNPDCPNFQKEQILFKFV